jgi:holo-[acyl-carrier protein] synthase
MVIGIGIDIVSVDELREQIEGVQNFLQEVFTAEEIATCSGRADPYQCFAARFAAKEAFMKAIGTGWTDDIDFLSISVASDGASVPTLTLDARAESALKVRGTFSTLLSLTHVPQYACAVVVLDQ